MNPEDREHGYASERKSNIEGKKFLSMQGLNALNSTMGRPTQRTKLYFG
jgi:hypothetical protein|tara:strand:+ start:708 stop:854 length:147 start_codon:yes stop_codon:yes gene_type:complete